MADPPSGLPPPEVPSMAEREIVRLLGRILTAVQLTAALLAVAVGVVVLAVVL